MSEPKTGFLTESFEQVVTTFYDAVRDTRAGGASVPDVTLRDEFRPSFGTDPATMKASVQAIVDEFRKTVRAPLEDGQSTPVGDECEAEVPEEKNVHRITTVATIHEPPPSLPKADDISPVVLSKKLTVASALETTAKRSLVAPTVPDEVHMESPPKATLPKATLHSKVVLRTHNPSHTIDFEWSLEKFSNYIEDLNCNFFAGDDCDKAWQARVALTAVGTPKVEHMAVYITLVSRFKGMVKGYFDLGIYNTMGEAFGKWVSVGNFTECSKEHLCFNTIRPAGIKSSDELKLQDDELIIRGCIAFTGCCVSTQIIEQPLFNIGTACKMAKVA